MDIIGDDQIKISYDYLMNSIEKRVNSVSGPSPTCSVFKVSDRLRNLKKDAYNPRMVSIGPLHASKSANLQAMEAHKAIYMQSLLGRTPEPDTTLDDCGKLILNLEKEARSCYADQDIITSGKNTITRLAEILLVDGCFILELFLRYSSKDSKDCPHDHSDPIFDSAWMIVSLQQDLLLLENQIPFFVLEKLFDTIVRRIPKRPPYSLTKFALCFFGSLLKFNQQAAECERDWAVAHLLDLIHKCYHPSTPSMVEPKCKDSWQDMPCVEKLGDAGIRFKMRMSNDIKFSKGVFKIPNLCVDGTTNSLFRNLIAYEQCCREIPQHITSYAVFMDLLIDTHRDVELLQETGIITNGLGDSEEVSRLFNSICKGVVVKDFYFDGLCEQVKEFYKTWWPRNKAILRRDYCSNPCRGISFAAASVLLVLTVFQTAYSMAAFYHP